MGGSEVFAENEIRLSRDELSLNACLPGAFEQETAAAAVGRQHAALVKAADRAARKNGQDLHLFHSDVIHDHTGDHLGIEVGGFLGHFLARCGNVANLGDAGGVEDERALEVALIDRDDRLLKELGIGQVDLIRHVLLVDTHGPLENQAVQDADVELLGGGTEVGQHLAHDGDIAQGQQVPLALADIEGERLFALLIFFVQQGDHGADAAVLFDLEVFGAAFEDGVWIKVLKVAHHAVGRENDQAGVLHVDEVHHLIILRVAGLGNAVFAAVVAVVDGGLIAVVTVGDIELAVGKVGAELLDDALVGDDPKAVGDAVVVGELIVGVALRLRVEGVEGGVLAVHVEGVDLAEIAVGRLHQVKAVGFRLGEGEFMGEDDALGEFLDLDAGDHALDAFALVVGVEFHFVDIDGGFVLVDQNPLAAPEIEDLARAGIDVVALLGKLQADDIVLVLFDKRLAFILADDVIGRAAEGVQVARFLGIEPHAAECFDFCHIALPHF